MGYTTKECFWIPTKRRAVSHTTRKRKVVGTRFGLIQDVSNRIDATRAPAHCYFRQAGQALFNPSQSGPSLVNSSIHFGISARARQTPLCFFFEPIATLPRYNHSYVRISNLLQHCALIASDSENTKIMVRRSRNSWVRVPYSAVASMFRETRYMDDKKPKRSRRKRNASRTSKEKHLAASGTPRKSVRDVSRPGQEAVRRTAPVSVERVFNGIAPQAEHIENVLFAPPPIPLMYVHPVYKCLCVMDPTIPILPCGCISVNGARTCNHR